MTKIISYNVNGIRSALNKNIDEWLKHESPDIFGVQETKANIDQVNVSRFEKLGYKHYWHSAKKKGYSGVAFFCKETPLNVHYGCGIQSYDDEGRIIRIDYKEYSIINVYMPSGSSGDRRQLFKIKFLEDFYCYVIDLLKKTPNLVVCGDFNICHKPIDIHNPIRNAKTSGFLPEERIWLSKFIDLGFCDTFRKFNKEPHRYSWWSYRANSRANNKGWRIDYQMATKTIKDYITKSDILHKIVHSDHCPTLLEIDL